MRNVASSADQPGDNGRSTWSRVRVRIAGDEYVLRGSASPEHLQRLSAELDRRLSEILKRHPGLLPHQAAVLCALQLLEELEQARLENRELLELLDEVR